LLKHIGSNWALSLLQILVMLVLSPFMADVLGKDDYGVWIAIAAATGFLDLLVLGVPMASVRHISEHVARKETGKANEVIATGLGICLVLGLGALLAGSAIFFGFEKALLTNPRWQNVTAETFEQARVAFVIVVVRIAAGFAMRLPIAVFDAHHGFSVRNAVLGGGLLFRLCALLAVLAEHDSLVVLAVVLAIEVVLVFVTLLALIHARYPGVRFGLGCFRRGRVRQIVGFGLFAGVLNVGDMLAYQSDALVIGAFLDPQRIAEFDFGNKFFYPLAQFMAGIGAVVMPTVTRMKAGGELSELRALFLKWSKISLSLVLLVGLYLTVLGPEFLGTWAPGPDYQASSGPITQILMPSFVMYLTVRAVALPILLGVGHPGRAALGLLGMGIANLALSVLLVRPFGIVGVALGTAIPSVLYAGWLLKLACKELGTGVGEYLRYVGGKPALGALPPLGLLLFLKYGPGIAGWPALLGSGLGLVVVFALCWVLFVYRDDPYLDLRAELAARFGRRAGGGR